MEISKEQNGKTLTVSLSGRLDTVAAAEFESSLNSWLEGVETLIFDCGKLEYVASSGLRAFLMAQKRMNKQGKMTMLHVQPFVMEVFTMTGFSDFLQFEP